MMHLIVFLSETLVEWELSIAQIKVRHIRAQSIQFCPVS